MIDTGALTDALLAHLDAETSMLIGDGLAPLEGGWLKGQPNQAAFRPYAVLICNGASPRDVVMTSSLPEWDVTWSLRCFGGSRKQVDWAAFEARKAVFGFVSSTFGNPSYKVYGLDWKQLGSVTRIDSVDPAFWQIFDTFTFACSK